MMRSFVLFLLAFMATMSHAGQSGEYLYSLEQFTFDSQRQTLAMEYMDVTSRMALCKASRAASSSSNGIKVRSFMSHIWWPSRRIMQYLTPAGPAHNNTRHGDAFSVAAHPGERASIHLRSL